MAQGQERDRVKELSYDYVSDEEDSTDSKWVVRMGSKKVFLEVSKSRPHIIILYFSNIVAILFIFLLESQSTKAGDDR